MRTADAVRIVKQHSKGFTPEIALVLGSGLGGLGDEIEPVARIDYADLPDFPKTSVAGHAGQLLLGHLASVPVLCLQGRVHLYEGGPPAQIAHLIRTARGAGAKGLILTNAAGSLRPEYGPGTPCLISDHINFQGTNPLIGANDDTFGPRFPDVTDLYDPALRAIVRRVADEEGIRIGEGVYMAFLGPCFETPAEIRMAKILGADLVGMSTVPEAIAARHCGLRILAISAIANLAAGMAEGALSHDETLREGARAGTRIAALLKKTLPGISDALS